MPVDAIGGVGSSLGGPSGVGASSKCNKQGGACNKQENVNVSVPKEVVPILAQLMQSLNGAAGGGDPSGGGGLNQLGGAAAV